MRHCTHKEESMTKKQKPIFSVIIQTRQTPFLILKRCIENIREQSLENIEIILLDSNEKDSSYKEALSAGRGQWKKIFYLEIPEKGEYVEGKNTALNIIHGEYIAFISAQDIMPLDRLEKIYHIFQKNRSYNAIYTNMAVQEDNLLDISDFSIQTGHFQYLGQVVFHKDCFQLIGKFDPDLVAHHDDEIWFRLKTMGIVHHFSDQDAAISICPNCYHGYTPLDAAIGYRQIYVKYSAYFKKNKKARKKLYHKIAEKYKEAGVIHRYIQFATKAIFTRT